MSNDCRFFPDPGNKVVCRACGKHLTDHPNQQYYKYPEYKKTTSVAERTAKIAEEQELPSRFKAAKLDNYKIEILDSDTGRTVIVGFHVYREVRRVLAELFK